MARKKGKKENSNQQGLTAIEMKLLRLALDAGAYEGEAENAAVMLIRKLRERGARADELFSASGSQTAAAVPKSGDEKMTFGKYKNERIKNIPTNYLI